MNDSAKELADRLEHEAFLHRTRLIEPGRTMYQKHEHQVLENILHEAAAALRSADADREKGEEEMQWAIETLRASLDRDWEGETFRQTVVIAANGLHWRQQRAERAEAANKALVDETLERAAKLCGGNLRLDGPHTIDYAAGCDDCADAIRALRSQP